MPKGNFTSRLKTAIGGNLLDHSFYRFLFMHISFLTFTGLPGVFINTFLMSQTKDINVVLFYNCLSFLGTAFGMFLSAAALHRFNTAAVAVVGIIGFNLLYLQLILLNTHSADYVVLLGITNGFAGSFYWMSYSQFLTEFSSLKNRDSALAILSISGSTVNLVVPFVSGIVISSVGGIHGYNVIFILAFVIAIFTAVACSRLPKSKSTKVHVQHTETVKHVIHNKSILFALLSEMCKGLREGIFGFILTILLYKFIKSELLIGFNTLLASLASIISFVFISRRVKSKNRAKYMKLAFLCLLMFSIFTLFQLNPIILIVFTMVNSFFSGFIVNSSFSTFLDAIQVVPGSNQKRPELFAQKELFLATGRCLGVLTLVVFNTVTGDSVFWQIAALALLTLTQIGTVALCGHTMKLTDEIRHANLKKV